MAKVKAAMAEQVEQRNPIDVLAEEFTERLRRGEHPSVKEYTDLHEDIADEIRELFPTIVAMERLKQSRGASDTRPVELRVDKLEQLGDYRIVREIGRGGMGIVYEAEQQSLERRVAVKVFPRQALGDSKHLRRFQRESRTAARLHHTNIVQVFGVGEQDGLHYYVMQFISGIGLDKVIEELRESAPKDGNAADAEKAVAPPTFDRFTATDAARALLSGKFAASHAAGTNSGPSQTRTVNLSDAHSATAPLASDTSSRGSADTAPIDTFQLTQERPLSHVQSAKPRDSDGDYWRSVARIGVQVAEALRYAHAQGTLHRDVKPANLMLDLQGTVWVTDFGLAKAVAQEALSRTGEIVGTLRYMAPEQLRGIYDARSDVYSLGLVLYELIALRPAFDDADQNRLIQLVNQGEPQPPRKLRPDIPRDLETIVLKATARDAGHRYQSAGELAEDLRRFLDDMPIRARRVSAVERLWRWSRRNPAIASLSAVLLLVVVTAFSAVSWQWRQAETEKQRAQDEFRRAQTENRRAEANLTLALDSMDQFLERFEASWMAHPTDLQTEEGDVEFRMVVADSTAIILQDALKFYDQFAEENATNPRLQRDTAKAHSRVGDIHLRLGQYDKAEAAYRQAVKILERQLAEFPEDIDLAIETAATLNQLGLVMQAVNRYEDAQQKFERAQQILADQLRRSPQSPPCRYELARTHSNLGGVVWRAGDRDAAPIHQRRAMSLLEELVKEHPDRAEYRLALAHAYRSYFPFVAFGRRRSETNRYRKDAVSIVEELVKDFPNVPDYQCELSEMLSMTGSMFRGSEDTSNPEPQLRRAVELARELTTKYPTIPRYRAALARALQGLAFHLRRTERAEEAEPLAAEVVAMYQQLADEFPSIQAYQFFLAMALHAHGDTLRDLERFAEARDVLEQAVAKQESLSESQSSSPFGKSNLLRQYESLARTYTKLGEEQQAEAINIKIDAIRVELRRSFPDFDRNRRR